MRRIFALYRIFLKQLTPPAELPIEISALMRDFPQVGLISDSDQHKIRAALFKLDEDLLEFDAQQLRGERMQSDDFVAIDDAWRTRARSYLAVIKDMVQKNVRAESLKERIFTRIVELEVEIETNRTSLKKVSDLWLGVTEAISRGTKNLEPAVGLIGRLAGALSSAKSKQQNAKPQELLPSPDDAGLIEVPDTENIDDV